MGHPVPFNNKNIANQFISLSINHCGAGGFGSMYIQNKGS